MVSFPSLAERRIAAGHGSFGSAPSRIDVVLFPPERGASGFTWLIRIWNVPFGADVMVDTFPDADAAPSPDTGSKVRDKARMSMITEKTSRFIAVGLPMEDLFFWYWG